MFLSIRQASVLWVVWSLCTGAGATSAPAPASDAKPRPPTSVRFVDAPSSETPAARRARLKKECKGRPNAGACLGHTR